MFLLFHSGYLGFGLNILRLSIAEILLLLRSCYRTILGVYQNQMFSYRHKLDSYQNLNTNCIIMG